MLNLFSPSSLLKTFSINFNVISRQKERNNNQAMSVSQLLLDLQPVSHNIFRAQQRQYTWLNVHSSCHLSDKLHNQVDFHSLGIEICFKWLFTSSRALKETVNVMLAGIISKRCASNLLATP